MQNEKIGRTRSSWLNCALRGEKAVYWISMVQQWSVLGGTESVFGGTVGNRYTAGKLEIWSGVTDLSHTD